MELFSISWILNLCCSILWGYIKEKCVGPRVGHLPPEGCKVSQISQNFTMFSLRGLCTSCVWSSLLTVGFPVEGSPFSDWWSAVISASQFRKLNTFWHTGVKTKGAGARMRFAQGEIGGTGREFPGEGELLCLVLPKKRKVTFRVAGLAVPGCEGPSTVVKSPTYAVLSRNQLCRELRARWGGVAKKWRMMTHPLTSAH